jgi:hypothetical protein
MITSAKLVTRIDGYRARIAELLAVRSAEATTGPLPDSGPNPRMVQVVTRALAILFARTWASSPTPKSVADVRLR